MSTILLTLLVLTVLGGLGWHQLSMGRLQSKFRAFQDDTKVAVESNLAGQTTDLLRLTGLPLAQAVRSDLLTNRLDDIDDLFRLQVKNRYVTRLVLVSVQDTILVATDKKLEGQLGSAWFADSMLTIPDPRIGQTPTEFLSAVPVMGIDSRLGTIILGYSKDSISDRIATLPTLDQN